MSYTNGLDKPSDYFNTKLYTGTGTSGSPFSLTGVGFAPNWVWIKRRGGATIGHRIFDTIRGATKYIDSSANSAETTNTSTLTAFGSDGFTLQNDGSVNDGSEPFVSWNWKAGGSASSNSDGSITSSVSANQDAGFSIVKYDSSRSPSAVQTVGHGLSVKPDILIFKNITESQNWLVWHKDIATNKHLNLNTTSALNTDAGSLNNTAPTSSVFTIGADGRTNSTTNGNPIICYAFAEKQGYSKFGSYTGNGSTDGTFVYTGFKPAFVLWKPATQSNTDWVILDNKRDTFNVADDYLLANSSNAEGNLDLMDFLSNGFKLRQVSGNNESGQTIIYMAFAESPFVTSTGIPTTAR